MKEVKGSILNLIVRLIKTNKNVYYNILSDDEKEFLSKRIVNSVCYPFKYYKRFLNLLSKFEAKSNKEVLKKWAQLECEAIMPRIYKSTIIKENIEVSLKKYNYF